MSAQATGGRNAKKSGCRKAGHGAQQTTQGEGGEAGSLQWSETTGYLGTAEEIITLWIYIQISFSGQTYYKFKIFWW